MTSVRNKHVDAGPEAPYYLRDRPLFLVSICEPLTGFRFAVDIWASHDTERTADLSPELPSDEPRSQNIRTRKLKSNFHRLAINMRPMQVPLNGMYLFIPLSIIVRMKKRS